MDHVANSNRLSPQASQSPDSGTWVSFEDGQGSNRSSILNNGVLGDSVSSPVASTADVLITLPKPPRKDEFPQASRASSTQSTPVVRTMSPQQELEEINRFQRILQRIPEDFTLDSVDIPDETTVTVHTDERDNGKILTTIRPTNERCAWISPPEYHPEMVPQKVAEILQVPLEDYVMNLDVLLSDYRFRIYVLFYKRIIGIWLLITLIVLLSLLFSGLRGLNLFAAGLVWLIIAGSGMCLCLYGKKKISDGLRLAVAHANKFMVKQRLIVGVEDRGKLSLHKVVVPIIHYDVMPCLAVIAQMLEEAKIVRTQNGGAVNVYSPSRTDLDAQDTSPMDKAELLMLRCSQPYVKELVKKRLVFHVTKVEDVGGVEPQRTANDHPQLSARHCQTSWCLCQFVDRMVLRRKPRKWFRKIWTEEF